MRAIRAEGGLLQASTTADMGRRIAETLNASVETALYSLEGGRPGRSPTALAVTRAWKP
jgi:hypothetical protein